MFRGLFFATPPNAVVDTGTDGAGEAGGEADVQTPAETTEVIEETPEEVEETQETSETEPEETPEPGRDDRGLPNHVKQALAKLREVDPKAAEVARRAYYEAFDYRQTFPSVREARAARDLLEEAGGAEGIDSMRGEVSEYASELKGFADGNPQVVEDLARDFPDSLVKLTPLAVDKLAEINPGAHDHLVAGIISSMFREKNVDNSIRRIVELIGDGKQKESHDLAKQLLEWSESVSAYAKSGPKRERSEEALKLQRDREQFDQERLSTFQGDVGSRSIQLLNTHIERQLGELLKGKKLALSKDQREGFINEARGIVARSLGKLPGYKDHIQQLIDARDSAGIVRFIESKLNAHSMVRKAAQTAWSNRGFQAARPKVKAAAGTTASPRPQFGAKPKAEEIDWSKDRSRLRFMQGEATLKNGTIRRWDVNA
jgi:hypothetical protein